MDHLKDVDNKNSTTGGMSASSSFSCIDQVEECRANENDDELSGRQSTQPGLRRLFDASNTLTGGANSKPQVALETASRGIAATDVRLGCFDNTFSSKTDCSSCLSDEASSPAKKRRRAETAIALASNADEKTCQFRSKPLEEAEGRSDGFRSSTAMSSSVERAQEPSIPRWSMVHNDRREEQRTVEESDYTEPMALSGVSHSGNPSIDDQMLLGASPLLDTRPECDFVAYNMWSPVTGAKEAEIFSEPSRVVASIEEMIPNERPVKQPASYRRRQSNVLKKQTGGFRKPFAKAEESPDSEGENQNLLDSSGDGDKNPKEQISTGNTEQTLLSSPLSKECCLRKNEEKRATRQAKSMEALLSEKSPAKGVIGTAKKRKATAKISFGSGLNVGSPSVMPPLRRDRNKKKKNAEEAGQGTTPKTVKPKTKTASTQVLLHEFCEACTSTAVQTVNCSSFVTEYLMEEWEKEGNVLSVPNMEAIIRRLKMACLLIRSQNQEIAKAQEKNTVMRKLFQKARTATIELKAVHSSEALRLRDDLNVLCEELRHYQLELRRACDANSVKMDEEAKQFTLAVKKLTDEKEALKAKLEERTRELLFCREELDCKTRELLVADRDVHLANEFAANTQKKLEDKLFLASHTKCASCSVSEKYRDVLTTQIADKTAALAQATSMLNELKGKLERQERAAQILSKENERTKFERDAWISDSKRLENEVKLLRAQLISNPSSGMTPLSNASSSSDASSTAYRSSNESRPSRAVPDVRDSPATSLSASQEHSPSVTEKSSSREINPEFGPLFSFASDMKAPNAFSSWVTNVSSSSLSRRPSKGSPSNTALKSACTNRAVDIQDKEISDSKKGGSDRTPNVEERRMVAEERRRLEREGRRRPENEERLHIAKEETPCPPKLERNKCEAGEKDREIFEQEERDARQKLGREEGSHDEEKRLQKTKGGNCDRALVDEEARRPLWGGAVTDGMSIAERIRAAMAKAEARRRSGGVDKDNKHIGNTSDIAESRKCSKDETSGESSTTTSKSGDSGSLSSRDPSRKDSELQRGVRSNAQVRGSLKMQNRSDDKEYEMEKRREKRENAVRSQSEEKKVERLNDLRITQQKELNKAHTESSRPTSAASSSGILNSTEISSKQASRSGQVSRARSPPFWTTQRSERYTPEPANAWLRNQQLLVPFNGPVSRIVNEHFRRSPSRHEEVPAVIRESTYSLERARTRREYSSGENPFCSRLRFDETNGSWSSPSEETWVRRSTERDPREQNWRDVGAFRKHTSPEEWGSRLRGDHDALRPMLRNDNDLPQSPFERRRLAEEPLRLLSDGVRLFSDDRRLSLEEVHRRMPRELGSPRTIWNGPVERPDKELRRPFSPTPVRPFDDSFERRWNIDDRSDSPIFREDPFVRSSRESVRLADVALPGPRRPSECWNKPLHWTNQRSTW